PATGCGPWYGSLASRPRSCSPSPSPTRHLARCHHRTARGRGSPTRSFVTPKCPSGSGKNSNSYGTKLPAATTPSTSSRKASTRSAPPADGQITEHAEVPVDGPNAPAGDRGSGTDRPLHGGREPAVLPAR